MKTQFYCPIQIYELPAIKTLTMVFLLKNGSSQAKGFCTYRVMKDWYYED